jgi:hypothetical protein
MTDKERIAQLESNERALRATVDELQQALRIVSLIRDDVQRPQLLRRVH